MKKRNWQNIKNSIVMLCVMLAMLSTVTYAWFTLTDSPIVNGLQMTAKAADSLLISKDQTNYLTAIDLESTGEYLSPVTVQDDAPTFAEPVYTGNKVASVNALASSVIETADNGYVLKYTYWLKSSTATPVNVGLLGGNGTADDTIGTFVMRKAGSTDTASQDASAAIRIGFMVEDDWIIYEPNTNVTFNGEVSFATNEIEKLVSDIQQNTNGTFKKGGATEDTSTITNALFEVGSTPVQVDMYVWLEGTDDQCVDQIQTDELMGQIQFTIVE